MITVPSDSAEEHMIKTWSFSRWSVFEQCPYRAKLAYIDKIPEPDRPLPPGKTEHANDRGTRIHEAAEAYVKGGVNLIKELQTFTPEFERARELFAEGRASLEGEWGFNREWNPVGWNSADVWVRVKLDGLFFLSDDHALIVDYKTGRKSGNEIKHTEQGQLYQLATFLRYPEIEKLDVEFWYTDQDDILSSSYTRDKGLNYLRLYTNRGTRITSEEQFRPNPNSFSCRFCPYGPRGTGHCKDGV